MRRTIALLTVIAAGLAGPALPASGQTDMSGGEAPITASLTGTQGTRFVSTVNAVTLNSILSGLPTGGYSVGVTELARSGTNSWWITGRVCGPDDTNTLVSNCTTHGDELVKSTDNAVTLGAGALGVDNQAVIELLPGGSGDLSAPGTASDFTTAQTLFTNSNQVTTTLYSEEYTATGDLELTPPDGTEATTYVGYFVVTLVQ